jgi:hypothetical protein
VSHLLQPLATATEAACMEGSGAVGVEGHGKKGSVGEWRGRPDAGSVRNEHCMYGTPGVPEYRRIPLFPVAPLCQDCQGVCQLGAR